MNRDYAPMRVECVSPLALEAQDVARWRGALAADAELTSPYLTPDWAQLVARHRGDVSVAVFRDDQSAAVGFLPVQLSFSNAAMPVGGPICDYQAFVGPAGVDLSLAVRELGVGRIDLTAGLANNAVSDCLFARDAGHVVRFADGWQAWCDQRAAAGSKTISRTRKKLSKLTRDNGGDVAVESFSTDPEAFREAAALEARADEAHGRHRYFRACVDRQCRARLLHVARQPIRILAERCLSCA
jgi:hypothetical protein